MIVIVGCWFFFLLLFNSENYYILLSRKHVGDPGITITCSGYQTGKKKLYLAG